MITVAVSSLNCFLRWCHLLTLPLLIIVKMLLKVIPLFKKCSTKIRPRWRVTINSWISAVRCHWAVRAHYANVTCNLFGDIGHVGYNCGPDMGTMGMLGGESPLRNAGVRSGAKPWSRSRILITGALERKLRRVPVGRGQLHAGQKPSLAVAPTKPRSWICRTNGDLRRTHRNWGRAEASE